MLQVIQDAVLGLLRAWRVSAARQQAWRVLHRIHYAHITHLQLQLYMQMHLSSFMGVDRALMLPYCRSQLGGGNGTRLGAGRGRC